MALLGRFPGLWWHLIHTTCNVNEIGQMCFLVRQFTTPRLVRFGNRNIPILPKAFLTFASKSAISPSHEANESITSDLG